MVRRVDKLADVVLAAMVGLTAVLSLYTFWSHIKLTGGFGQDVEATGMTVLWGIVIASSAVVALREYQYYLGKPEFD